MSLLRDVRFCQHCKAMTLHAKRTSNVPFGLAALSLGALPALMMLAATVWRPWRCSGCGAVSTSLAQANK